MTHYKFQRIERQNKSKALIVALLVHLLLFSPLLLSEELALYEHLPDALQNLLGVISPEDTTPPLQDSAVLRP